MNGTDERAPKLLKLMHAALAQQKLNPNLLPFALPLRCAAAVLGSSWRLAVVHLCIG